MMAEENKPEVKEQVLSKENSAKETSKKESKPAVKKDTKKVKEEKIELEREYVIPLRKSVLKAQRYRRAKKAIKVIKEFLAKHMKVENRDLKKVKIDLYLNNEVWFRGIKKPANKIKVKAVKKGGIVYAELAEIPKAVKFVIEKDKRKSEKAQKAKVKMPKHPEKEKEKEEGEEDKTEKEKATVEAGLEMQKQEAKALKHTSKQVSGEQENFAGRTQRKALKR
ncbi:MAG: 50S ribosomal protein L31e [Candidatus Pacearchaeota archaeon]